MYTSHHSHVQSRILALTGCPGHTHLFEIMKLLSRIAHAAVASCAFSLALSSVSLGASVPGTRLTHELLWMMKRVSAPVISPDGKWVICAVLEPSYEPEKEVSDLWLVPTDGSAAPRRITNTRSPESGVSWSPDGRSIAFATKREGDEAEQIYILDIASGGEAHRLTDVSTGASSPKWRPDGKAILFESRVYPNALDEEANRKAAAEHKARKYNVRTYEHYPVRQWNQWLDERQPAILVQSVEAGGEAGSKAKDILSATALAHETGFAGVPDPTSAGSSLAPMWSLDGKEIVFTATTERWNAVSGHVGFHLYRIDATGGAEPKIVTPAAGEYGDAAFSPDGKTLFFKYT